MATRDSPKGLAQSISLGEPIDIVLGLTAAAITGDQLLKASHSQDHKKSHLLKAGLGATVAVGALAMLRQDHKDRHPHHVTEQRRETVVVRRNSDAGRRPLLEPRARTAEEGQHMLRDRRRDEEEGARGRRNYGDRLLPVPQPGGPRARDRSAGSDGRRVRREESRGRELEDDRDRGLGSRLGPKFRSHSARPPPKLNDEHLTVDEKGQVYGLNASYYFPDMADRFERRR